MFNLTISAPADTELTIVQSDLQPVSQGVGELKAALDPGLYKVTANLSGHLSTRLISLEQDEHLTMEMDVHSPFVPASGELTGLFCQKLLDPNLTAPSEFVSDDRQIDQDGESATILICFGPFREASAEQRLASSTMMQWRSVQDAQAIVSAMKRIELDDQWWQAVRFQVPVGSYLIECGSGSLLRRQMVPALRGYESRVFATHDNHNASRDLTFFLDIVKPFQQPWSDLKQSNAEIVQNALWHHRAIIIDDQGIKDYQDEKFADPIVGLAAAFLMVDALQEKQNASEKQLVDVTFPAERIGIVFRNLVRLFAGLDYSPDDVDTAIRLPPDLVALGLAAEPFFGQPLISREQYKIVTPPVFYRSWEILLKHAAREGRVWVNGGLWSELAQSAPLGPYFAWHPATSKIRDAIGRIEQAELLAQRTQEIANRIVDAGVKAETYADFLRKNAPDVLRDLNEKRLLHKLPLIAEQISQIDNLPDQLQSIVSDAASIIEDTKTEFDDLTPDRLLEIAQKGRLPDSVISAFGKIGKLGKMLKSGY